MSFFESLENIDREILLGINGSHSPFLDNIMYLISEKWIMIPVYLLLLYFLQKHYGWKATGIILITALLMVVICDLTITHLIKNTVERYRPSHNEEIKNKLHFVNDYKGATFGFVSSHAANMMSLAVFLGYFLYGKVKHYAPLALFLVLVISLSRIYLGVHYPSDILGGLLVGFVFGNIFIFWYSNLFGKIIREKI